ncbi:glycosyl hydrolase [Ilyonectria robusta]|uniref:glycosyl hydrolase n=1 Tax=Ilyonectria robusta TaxID=1079257 RepID=UPI001E8ED4A0|nr:glycosyl hydrolase [Ilyonectria robusta]KAH8658543.1 glycosyl hydrolase [Ilyonectria robusta]
MAVVNPVLTGFNPDPSITRVGDDFFLATSSFEYLPGVPIYHSKDLIRWKLIGHALTRRSQIHIAGPEPGGGVWAPTLRYHDNVFYLATSSFDRFRPQQNERLYPRGFYVRTENIWDSSSWLDPVYFDVIGFDQDLFWDADGSVYLSTTHVKADRPPDADKSRLDFAIHVCKVDLNTGDSISESVMIRESPTGISEGSHIFQRGRYYYLLTAEGGTGSRHSVWAFRNDQGPLGAWEACPKNPLLRSGTENKVQNTGHADLVEDINGQWWAVLLGVRPYRRDSGEWEESVFGRETFVVPVQWIDDWPVINRGDEIRLGPELEASTETLWRDDFSEPVLGLGWYRKNTPDKLDHAITSNPSRLRLYGGPYNLSVPASPTMFLRKQTLRCCIWETKVSFHPTTEHEEAGSVLWWNYLTYSSIGIRKARRGDGMSPAAAARMIHLRSARGDAVSRLLEQPDSDVCLYIRCGKKYEFGFRELVGPGDEDGPIQWLGEASNEVMTNPPSAGLAFSGMMFGLYAFADYQQSLNAAEFHYAQVKLIDGCQE